jgi:F0F1-type ATP synthase delta subunit
MTKTDPNALTPLTVRIPRQVQQDLEVMAKAQGMGLAELVRQALDDHVQRHRQTRPARQVTTQDLSDKLDTLLSAAADQDVQRRKTDAVLDYLSTALGLKK